MAKLLLGKEVTDALNANLQTRTAALREKGILIRNCENYAGLRPGWYRIAVRTHEENEALLRAVREV